MAVPSPQFSAEEMNEIFEWAERELTPPESKEPLVPEAVVRYSSPPDAGTNAKEDSLPDYEFYEEGRQNFDDPHAWGYGATTQGPYPTMPPVPDPGLYRLPPAVPDVSAGVSYHPAVGYYFPAVPAPAYPASLEMPPTHEGYVPIRNDATASSDDSSTSRTKRKQPPSDQSAGNARKRVRTQGVSTAASNFQSTFRSPDPLNSLSILPTVRTCVCFEKNKVKRPRNRFIIYRSAKSQAILRSLAGTRDSKNNAAVSRKAGEMWKKEPKEVQDHYTRLAEVEKKRHAKENKGYKYQPNRTRRLKFGSKKDCICGAYEENMEALKRDPEYFHMYARAVEEEDEDPGEDEDVEVTNPREHQSKGTHDANFPPTVLQRDFNFDFDFDNPPWACQQQAQQPAALMIDPEPSNAPSSLGITDALSHSPARRRSSRLQGKNITFLNMDDNEDDDGIVVAQANLRRSPTLIEEQIASLIRSTAVPEERSASTVLRNITAATDALITQSHNDTRTPGGIIKAKAPSHLKKQAEFKFETTSPQTSPYNLRRRSTTSPIKSASPDFSRLQAFTEFDDFFGSSSNDEYIDQVINDLNNGGAEGDSKSGLRDPPQPGVVDLLDYPIRSTRSSLKSAALDSGKVSAAGKR